MSNNGHRHATMLNVNCARCRKANVVTIDDSRADASHGVQPYMCPHCGVKQHVRAAGRVVNVMKSDTQH